MAMTQDEESFTCPVCLDLMKDPVAIPCGHNFCMSCINGCWDQEDQKGVYSCPLCKHTFTLRPVLYKNPLIAEMVEKLRKNRIQVNPASRCYAGPGDVECDICTGRKLKAVKSCLECLVSYCESHYKAHNELNPGRRHKVVAATGQLQERLCSLHKKPLEIFCRTDQTCVCLLCLVDEHKGHDTVSASSGRKERQMQFGQTQRRCRQRITKREKELLEMRNTVKSIKSFTQTAVEDSERIFTEMIRSIERRRSEVTELIRDQEKAAESQAEGLLKQLEQEIAELKRRDAELEKLSHTDDHIYFLKNVVSITDVPYSTVSTSMTFRQKISFEALKESVSALKMQLEEKLDDIIMQEVVKISAADDILVEVGVHPMLNKSCSVAMPAAQQGELQLQRSYSVPMHKNVIRATATTTPVHLTLDRQRPSSTILASSFEYGGRVESAHLQLHQVEVVLQRGPWGFGFTFVNSPLGHKVNKILDEQRCRRLLKGDIIKEVNQRNVETLSNTQVVALLKEVPIGAVLTLLVLREASAANAKELDVFIKRDRVSGFGITIRGGEDPEKPVYIGAILPLGAAERDGQLQVGDELICVDGTSIIGYSHKQVVDLMTNAAQTIMITIRR